MIFTELSRGFQRSVEHKRISQLSDADKCSDIEDNVTNNDPFMKKCKFDTRESLSREVLS